jgi:hypothetical protein
MSGSVKVRLTTEWRAPFGFALVLAACLCVTLPSSVNAQGQGKGKGNSNPSNNNAGSSGNQGGQSGFNGAQPLAFSGGNIFSVVGDTVIVTGDLIPTNITLKDASGGADLWTRQLLGINGIWVVDGSGNALAGTTLTVTDGGGYVTGPTKPELPWSTSTTPDGYTDGVNGAGFKMNGNGQWLQIAPDSTFTALGTPSGYKVGYFTFTGLGNLLASNPNGLYLGIDYLVLAPPSNTTTGRGFGLVSFPDNNSALPAVPEPGAMVIGGFFATAVGGRILKARKRRRQSRPL